jgi:group I intron endonuclease
MGHIYSLTNTTNGKRYIGQTSRSFLKRVNEHIKWSDNLINKAIKKYGVKNFSYQTWEVSDEQLDSAEISIIKQLNTMAPNGYNLTEGGEGGNLCNDIKLKISNTMKNQRCGKLNNYAKSIVLIHPTGEEEKFECINDACKKYNLNNSHISQVAKGNRKQHKGYKAKILS